MPACHLSSPRAAWESVDAFEPEVCRSVERRLARGRRQRLGCVESDEPKDISLLDVLRHMLGVATLERFWIRWMSVQDRQLDHLSTSETSLTLPETSRRRNLTSAFAPLLLNCCSLWAQTNPEGGFEFEIWLRSTDSNREPCG
jgi:hypothetical protein